MPTGFHENRLVRNALADVPAHENSGPVAWGAVWKKSPLHYAAMTAALVVAGAVALTIDLPLAQAMVHGRVLRALHGFLGSFEPFGQPAAILVVAAAIALCDPRRRLAMPRLVAAAFGSGLAADLLKLLVARTRPHHQELAGSVLETFRGFLPGVGAGSAMQSFPSAHTAMAVGFALALTTLFPAGRWLFACLASLVALQRVEAGAHYLSDTCWGAAVGSVVGLLVFHPALLGAWFDRKEQEWSRPRDDDDRPVRERLSIVSAEEEASPADDR